jgi:hypothetical protein
VLVVGVVVVEALIAVAVDERMRIVPRRGQIGEVWVAEARGPDSLALAATDLKRVLDRICRDDRRSAGGLAKPVGGPACRGPRDRTSRNARAALAVEDNVPEWRIAHNSDRPENCVPQTGRVRAIGRAWPDGQASDRVSLECSDLPRGHRCLDRLALIDRGLATAQELATLPASALGRARAAVVSSSVRARAPELAAADNRYGLAIGPDGQVLGRAQAAVVSRFVPALGPVKTAEVSKSALTGPMVDRIGLMVGQCALMAVPDDPMAVPDDPAIVGPI